MDDRLAWTMHCCCAQSPTVTDDQSLSVFDKRQISILSVHSLYYMLYTASLFRSLCVVRNWIEHRKMCLCIFDGTRSVWCHIKYRISDIYLFFTTSCPAVLMGKIVNVMCNCMGFMCRDDHYSWTWWCLNHANNVGSFSEARLLFLFLFHVVLHADDCVLYGIRAHSNIRTKLKTTKIFMASSCHYSRLLHTHPLWVGNLFILISRVLQKGDQIPTKSDSPNRHIGILSCTLMDFRRTKTKKKKTNQKQNKNKNGKKMHIYRTLVSE